MGHSASMSWKCTFVKIILIYVDIYMLWDYKIAIHDNLRQNLTLSCFEYQYQGFISPAKITV